MDWPAVASPVTIYPLRDFGPFAGGGLGYGALLGISIQGCYIPSWHWRHFWRHCPSLDLLPDYHSSDTSSSPCANIVDHHVHVRQADFFIRNRPFFEFSRSLLSCETCAKGNMVMVFGRITTKAIVGRKKFLHYTYCSIELVYDDVNLYANHSQVLANIEQQSPDVTQTHMATTLGAPRRSTSEI
ncbi:hypothetical protein Taro_007339 [Colocasia esculenta]|uniref:Uncharacterized protein n=1 Tax=Colocasia esculenta TaxID=4460 RepID=A0A843TUS1_COLES|nr:hypothetical protein [Colocasia esculenta]